jgi:hypothetical protein
VGSGAAGAEIDRAVVEYFADLGAALDIHLPLELGVATEHRRLGAGDGH